MRSSYLSAILLSLLFILGPALARKIKPATLDKQRAESLFTDGTPLFSPVEDEDTEGLSARWILDDDTEKAITRIWDNTKTSDTIGVVMSDAGAWAFRITEAYQKKLFKPSAGYQATFIYESDDFYSKIAYPLFGHADPRTTPPLPGAEAPSRSPSSLSAHKTNYHRAFILSVSDRHTKAKKSNEPFITALAWAMTHSTGLEVQWTGQLPYSTSPKHFVLRRQPNHERHDYPDFEIFYVGVRLLTATVVSARLSVSEYGGFTDQSFRKIEDEIPDRKTVVNSLWNKYPALTQELGFKKEGPKARFLEWHFDTEKQPAIYRHYNGDDGENLIMILVVTTTGSWILTLSTEYVELYNGANTRETVRNCDAFSEYKKHVLEVNGLESGQVNTDSWEYAADRILCSGGVLINVVVMTGYAISRDPEVLVHKSLVQAFILEMMTTSPAARVLLNGFDEREMPFFQFPKQSRQRPKGKEFYRLVMRHFTSADLKTVEGKRIGEGEFFECYYGNDAIIKAVSGEPLPGQWQNQFSEWSDPPTEYFTLS